MADSSDPLRIVLHPDGGIVVHPQVGQQPEVATTWAAGDWVRNHMRRRNVVVEGALEAPVNAPVVERVTEIGGDRITMTATTPEPFVNPGWTTATWAAHHGRVPIVRDLLERGASMDAPIPSWQRPFRATRSAWNVAMQRGDVPVLQALCDAGMGQQAGPRPPDRPDALVVRVVPPWHIVTWVVVLTAAFPVVVGVVGGEPVTGLWVGLVIAAFGVLFAVLGVVLRRMSGIAVDGSEVWMRRMRGWQGPVDMAQLVALGFQETSHHRSPAYIHLGNHQHGQVPTRIVGRRGLDPDQVAALGEIDGRVLTLRLGHKALRPGFDRWVAAHVDRAATSVSSSAEALFRA